MDKEINQKTVNYVDQHLNKIGYAWLGYGAAGFLPGSVLMPNLDFQIALCRYTKIVEPNEGSCTRCGLSAALTSDANHYRRCIGRESILLHDTCRDAVQSVLRSAAPNEKQANSITGETEAGTVRRPNGTRTAKRADLYIPANAIEGVGAQMLDFRFFVPNAASPKRLQGRRRKRDETAENYAREAVIGSGLNQAQWSKNAEYSTFEQSPGQPNIPVTPVVMTVAGTLHSTARAWLKTLPTPIRLAVRRALSHIQQVFLNRCVEDGVRITDEAFACA